MRVVGQTARGARQKASPWSSSPWHAKTFEMYDAACRACESHVRIKTTDDWQVFLGHVHTIRRQERGGQIATTDIPALGIAKNLRVESPPTCWSSLKLEEFAASFPPAGVHITSWNPSADTLARHRNPLFGVDLLPQDLLPDELHTMLHGVFQMFCAHRTVGPHHLRCVARVSRHGCARVRCKWRVAAGVRAEPMVQEREGACTRHVYEMPDFSFSSRDSRELTSEGCEVKHCCSLPST